MRNPNPLTVVLFLGVALLAGGTWAGTWELTPRVHQLQPLQQKQQSQQPQQLQPRPEVLRSTDIMRRAPVFVPKSATSAPITMTGTRVQFRPRSATAMPIAMTGTR